MPATTSPEAGAGPPGGADALLGGRVRVVQPASGYRAAVDPVLLAASVPAAPGERVLDLGAGVGAAAMCLAARIPGVLVEGIELQPDLAAAAAEGARLSGLADRVRVVAGDLRGPPGPIAAGGYDHVLANPPYLRAGGATPPPDASKAAANVEGEGGLPAWTDAAARLLRPRGLLALVHRADRLGDVLSALRPRFGGLVLLPVHPRAGAPATRILVSARLGGRGPDAVLPGLVLHGAGGGFADAVEAVLRDAAAIPMRPPAR
jgi:tRNA1(Val) A37 N6-methylase TrmN6